MRMIKILVHAYSKPNVDKDILLKNMKAGMPSTRDTSIQHIYSAMENEGLALEMVNSTYLKKGGQLIICSRKDVAIY